MSHIVFQDPTLLRYLFSTISRFVDKVHFDINENGIRIKSIDPHDFCYLDLLFLKNYFESYEIKNHMSFGVDISKLRYFLPKISGAKKIEFEVNNDFLYLIASKDWKMTFKIGFLEKDPYNLKEPKDINYDSDLIISAKDFSKLIAAASTISTELSILIDGKNLMIRSDSGDYSFIGQPSQILEFNKDNKKIESSVISKYLSYLNPLIKRCDRVRIWLGIEKPVRFDMMYRNKATFSFIHSQRRLKTLSLKTDSKGKRSLPRLTSSKLPELLLYLFNSPEGENIRVLKGAGLETDKGDYGRVANKLKLVTYSNGKIHITDDGILFVNLLKNDPKNAKNFLHKLSYSHIEEYRLLIKMIKEKPLPPNELFHEINNNIKKLNKRNINEEYMNILLGLGIWSGILDNKLALYYFKT